MTVGHGQAGREVEVAHVEPEGAVRLEVDEFIQNRIDVTRLAIRREAHHFVFAGVDLEAGVIGEGGIEQSERMGKVDLPLRGQPVVFAQPDRSGRPLADSVQTEHRGALEGAGKNAEAAWA